MGTQELLIILVIVLLIFGARKLPDLARSLGSSAKEFRKGIEDGSTEDEDPTTAHSSEVPPQSDPRDVPDPREVPDS